MLKAGLLIGGLLMLFFVGCQRADEMLGPIVRSATGTIVGASMAPAVWGAHYQCTCLDCDFVFRFSLPPNQNIPTKLICPNCGFGNSQTASTKLQSPEQVTIEPTQTVARWDVVAFQPVAVSNSDDLPPAGIKRVVGLPNESITICLGDLWCGQQVLRKLIPIQKQMRIHVYDSLFQSRSFESSRWAADSSSAWKYSPQGWRFCKPASTPSANASKRQAPATLTYQHWRCCLHPGQRDQIFPVEDVDWFNPTLARNLNSIDDLFVQLDCELTEHSQFGWRFYRDGLRFDFLLDVAARRLTRSTVRLDEMASIIETKVSELDAVWFQKLRNSEQRFDLKIEFSSFDRQQWVSINDQEVHASEDVNELNLLRKIRSAQESAAEQSHDESDSPPRSISKNLKFELTGVTGDALVRRSRIWRDVYYLPAEGTIQTLSTDAAQIVLLGDNTAVSRDSRQWQPSGIPVANVLGVVQ